MNKLQAIAAMFDGATVMNPQLPNHVFFIDPKGKLPDIMVFERETKPQSISVDSIGSADGWEVVNPDFRRNVEAAAGPAAPEKSDLEHWLTDGTINEITGSWPSFEAQSHACKVVRMVVDKLGLQLPPPDAPVPTAEGPIGEVGPYVRPEEEQTYYRRCRALELALEHSRRDDVRLTHDGIIMTANAFEGYMKYGSQPALEEREKLKDAIGKDLMRFVDKHALHTREASRTMNNIIELIKAL